MRSTLLCLVACAFVLLAGACSSTSKPAPATGDDGGADAGSLITASYQMQMNVPAGGELFMCQMVTLPDVQAFLVKGQHQYTPGSHHLIMYTTDLTSIPAGLDQIQDCYENDAGSIMSYVRGILYSGQTPTGEEVMPPTIGLPTTASQVLIFQVHYLNATANDLTANVNVDLTLDTNPDDIQTHAGILFFYDPFIDVPPGAMATAQMRCPIPDDITMIYASSHYHSRGVGYGAWIDSTPTQLSTTPFYTSASWSSPPNQQMSMPVAAGTQLRWQCQYDNSQGTEEYFQGQSALTNEMCMFIGLYYPDMGQIADFCISGADYFGTGSTACGDTLTCLQGCGSKISLGLSGILSGAGTPDCEQKCMVQSCPMAADSLMPFVTCMDNSCKSQCSTPSSSACTSCIASNCLNEYTTCSQDTCN
jgi:hypothetical protein